MTSVLALFALLRMQSDLPLSEGHQNVSPALAFNTAVSFTTNTSWENYAGEATLGHLAVAAGLGVAAFISAAVGMAAGVALVRSLARHETDRVGNFWVDLMRGSLCILLPLSILFAIVLIASGVVQNLAGPQTLTTLVGGHQSILGDQWARGSQSSCCPGTAEVRSTPTVPTPLRIQTHCPTSSRSR